MKKIQIGVMGSCAELKYSKSLEKLAEEVGFFVAQKGAALLFGPEKDEDSLSAAACRGAKKAGGLTIGIAYEKGVDGIENHADIVLSSGMSRGGGREFILVLSCDAVITLGGGSGTLTEIAMAYQANIPVIAIENTGGWSDKLIDQFLDDRKRIKIEKAVTPKEAVEKAIMLITKRNESK